MRILSVTETYAPFFEFGGPPVKVRALAEGLAKRGQEVTVLTADWGVERRIEGQLEKIAADRSPFGWRIHENGVQAIYLPTWLRYRALTWNPAVNRYCRARLGKFEVVHIFGLYDLLGPAVAAACRRHSVNYVLEPIGMFMPIVRNVQLKRLYHLVWGRAMFQGASLVIATSEQEAEELVNGGVSRKKVVLRRNGVDAPAPTPKPGFFREAQGISKETKLVLFLGRLSVKKSPELLLRAVASLPTTVGGRPWMLVYAGPDEGGMQAQLQQLASQLNVQARVRFVGSLFDTAKWAAYQDADVFVLPSQNENFGNTAGEAVAAGTPVIVTKQCGIAPLVAPEAGLVVEHETAALSQALLRILGDEEEHARLSAGCAMVSQRLGWEEPVRTMETLYTTLATKQAVEAESLLPGK